MDAIKLPFQFDPERLVADWNKIAETELRPITNNYVDLDTIFCLELLQPTGEAVTEHRFGPKDLLKNSPYLLEVYNTLKCDVDSFRIHTLHPGSHIRKHRDTGRSFDQGMLRLHIPIQTNDRMETLLNDQPVTMKPGEFWYLNFDKPHELVNKGDEVRVHIIIDCYVNDWWRDIFANLGYQKEEQGSSYQSAEDIENMIVALEAMDSDVAGPLIADAKAKLAKIKGEA